MEIRKLEAFCRIVELKSFTKAAEAVFLTQPTVSQHIQDLEQELDQKLFDRLGRQIIPTHVGRIFYDYASRILQIQTEAVQAVEKYCGRLTGRIQIGCGTIPGTYILPDLIGRFRRSHPDIKASVYISSSKVIAGNVIAGEYETGVVGARWKEESLVWNKVFTDELKVIVHPDHCWAAEKQIPLEKIADQPFIFREPESGTRRVIAQFLKDNGLNEKKLSEVAQLGSTAAVKEMVKKNAGISIISRQAVEDDISWGRLAAISIKGHKLQRPFYLIKRRNRNLSPVAAAFQAFLITEAEKN